MIEDFKAISEILEGVTKDIGMEPGEILPDAPQTAQLPFEPDPGHAAAAIEQAEASTVNVEEVSQPEQLALF